MKENKPGVETIRVLQSVRIIVEGKNNIAKTRAPTSNDTLVLRGAKIEQDEIDIKHSLSEQQTEQDINQSPHIPTMRLCTYEQVKKMIHHIVEDNLSINEASRRANISATSALKYYKKYVEDPEHKIPISYNGANRSPKRCTQAQINALIGYIVNDKMSLATASVKADMSEVTGRIYYELYIKNRTNATTTTTTWQVVHRKANQRIHLLYHAWQPDHNSILAHGKNNKKYGFKILQQILGESRQ